MPRAKSSVVSHHRHKKILKLARGYRGAKSKLFRVAKQQVMKSLTYAYRDRKVKKREFRKLWIARINAAARMNGISYSRLMNGLKRKSTGKCCPTWPLTMPRASAGWWKWPRANSSPRHA